MRARIPVVDARLHIAPEVEAILDSATLSDAIAKRAHTELGCAACGEPIPPESPAPASLLLVRAVGQRNRYLVCFTHAGCAESQVVDTESTAAALGSVTWTPVLRTDARPRAALLLELHDYVSRAPLAGLAPVTEAVAAATAPAVEGASVRLGTGMIVLTLPGAEPLELDEAGAVFPPEWHAVAVSESAVLLLAGTAMGLDRPDAERIDQALQLGRVAGATVPCG